MNRLEHLYADTSRWSLTFRVVNFVRECVFTALRAAVSTCQRLSQPSVCERAAVHEGQEDSREC